MSSQSAKELVDELNKSKVEISQLKNSLNELNAEKELMKKIKELRKGYDKASILEESNKKMGDISDSAGRMRREANNIHKSIQEKAKESQALHQEIIRLSAEIDKMKIEEEDAFKKFSELKKKFNEANSQLKEKLRAMNNAKESLDKIGFERRERKRMQEESFLKSKEEEVNQKLKSGKKLTTEDLLVFQQKFGK